MKTTKKSNVFVKTIKKIANFFDRILITPISKLAYFIKEKWFYR